MRDAEWWRAGANVLAQNALGIALAVVGMALGRSV